MDNTCKREYCDKFLGDAQKHFSSLHLNLLEHCIKSSYLTWKIEWLKEGTTTIDYISNYKK